MGTKVHIFNDNNNAFSKKTIWITITITFFNDRMRLNHYFYV